MRHLLGKLAWLRAFSQQVKEAGPCFLLASLWGQKCSLILKNFLQIYMHEKGSHKATAKPLIDFFYFLFQPMSPAGLR